MYDFLLYNLSCSGWLFLLAYNFESLAISLAGSWQWLLSLWTSFEETLATIGLWSWLHAFSWKLIKVKFMRGINTWFTIQVIIILVHHSWMCFSWQTLFKWWKLWLNLDNVAVEDLTHWMLSWCKHPLASFEGIHSEVAFVDWNDHSLLFEELCKQAWDPESAFIVGWVYVLNHCGLCRFES